MHEANTPEELVALLHTLLTERRFAEATDLVGDVDERFPESPVAHHAAGLAWERSWIERNTEGDAPPLSFYERAEHHYRRALDLDGENRGMHIERLFACVFVLGSQSGSEAKLREAVELADEMASLLPETEREPALRDGATAASALARTSRTETHWEDAARRFDELTPPEGGREAYFHHHFRGMAKRELAQRRDSQELLAEAVDAFRQARTWSDNAALAYLLADCLLQLSDPSEADMREAGDLVAALLDDNPNDPLVAGVARRLAARTIPEKADS